MNASASTTTLTVKATSLLLAIRTVIDKCFAILASASLLAIAAVVLLQVISRFMLPTSPVWTEELSRYLFIYLIVLSSGLVIRDDRHVRLELFQGFLNPFWKRLYTVACHVLTAAFALYLIPFSMQYAQIGKWQMSPTLEMPMLWVFISVTIFFYLTAFYSVLGAILELLSSTQREEQ
ncbi:TRAP transporter small permease [Marinomonas atlantica]|uniref:TRAP transporter small permease n=1 Tax=Marinomonas atlantica TaxID=1806668 RepID=UPI00082AE84F|nr:TRAP transporter small permease [Marinomonas atlantica]